jgi:hypothetical protein
MHRMCQLQKKLLWQLNAFKPAHGIACSLVLLFPRLLLSPRKQGVPVHEAALGDVRVLENLSLNYIHRLLCRWGGVALVITSGHYLEFDSYGAAYHSVNRCSPIQLRHIVAGLGGNRHSRLLASTN